MISSRMKAVVSILFLNFVPTTVVAGPEGGIAEAEPKVTLSDDAQRIAARIIEASDVLTKKFTMPEHIHSALLRQGELEIITEESDQPLGSSRTYIVQAGWDDPSIVISGDIDDIVVDPDEFLQGANMVGQEVADAIDDGSFRATDVRTALQFKTKSFQCVGDYKKCKILFTAEGESEVGSEFGCGITFLVCIAERIIPLAGGE